MKTKNTETFNEEKVKEMIIAQYSSKGIILTEELLKVEIEEERKIFKSLQKANWKDLFISGLKNS